MIRWRTDREVRASVSRLTLTAVPGVAQAPGLSGAAGGVYDASGANQTTASGGTVTAAENGSPCHPTGSATTPPRLPWLLPP